MIDNDGFAIPTSIPNISNNSILNTNKQSSIKISEGTAAANTGDDPTSDDKSLRLADKFQIDEKTMQKLIDLEKTLKDRKTGGSTSRDKGSTAADSVSFTVVIFSVFIFGIY